MISNNHLWTKVPDGLFLLGPVLATWGIPEAPLGYLSLQLVVGLLQPVNLLHKTLQSSIQVPHGVAGVLQQVHGVLGEHSSKCLVSHKQQKFPRVKCSTCDGQNTEPVHSWKSLIHSNIRVYNFHSKHSASHLKPHADKSVFKVNVYPLILAWSDVALYERVEAVLCPPGHNKPIQHINRIPLRRAGWLSHCVSAHWQPNSDTEKSGSCLVSQHMC